MPVPLIDDLLEYSDGTPATVEQMSLDVTHFLNWAAEPELKRASAPALCCLSI